MAHEHTTGTQGLKLPGQIIGSADINRVLREIETLDDFLRQAAIRETGNPLKLPRTSHLLNEFAELNKLNLLQEQHRRTASTFLGALKKDGLTIHISFAADPSATFVNKIVTWLRDNIHPHLLVQVGLQPTIAAGCIVRTPNHYFDFSLRHRFDEQRDLLMAKLDKGKT